MACNCGKKKVSVQPKKIVKTTSSQSKNSNPNRRIIRRTAR